MHRADAGGPGARRVRFRFRFRFRFRIRIRIRIRFRVRFRFRVRVRVRFRFRFRCRPSCRGPHVVVATRSRDGSLARLMPVPEISARTTRILRIAMLGVIALVALANAAGWVDADLWIPFVCIIAVMGVGTRGGPVDRLSFVLIEASVVLLLGVATFSGSRDAVWVASVAVSVLAIGKIALVEMHRRDAELEAKEVLERAKERDPQALSRSLETTLGRRVTAPSPIDASAVREAASKEATAKPAERPAIPRTISELPPPPMLPAPTSQHDATPPLARTEAEPAPKKRRDRNDPTPRAVPIRR